MKKGEGWRIPGAFGAWAVLCALLMAACTGGGKAGSGATQTTKERPSILLVTLDTTRADAIGPDAAGVQTPAFNAVAARGRRFTAGVRHGAGDAAVAQLDA